MSSWIVLGWALGFSCEGILGCAGRGSPLPSALLPAHGETGQVYQPVPLLPCQGQGFSLSLGTEWEARSHTLQEELTTWIWYAKWPQETSESIPQHQKQQSRKREVFPIISFKAISICIAMSLPLAGVGTEELMQCRFMVNEGFWSHNSQ